MRSAVNHVRELSGKSQKPWLVVGKGPTTDFISRIDLSGYNTLTLNHACVLLSAMTVPDVAHFVDLDAFLDCRDVLHLLQPQGTVVAMPWHPHVHFEASHTTLADQPAVAAFDPVSYNATTAGKRNRHPDLPILKLRYFSATAAFNILAAAGVRRIDSIGVDGGDGYGQSFDARHRLSNGRLSFDAQMGELTSTCKTNKIRWTRLCADADKL